jgi:hypothetical protein
MEQVEIDFSMTALIRLMIFPITVYISEIDFSE